MVPLESLLGKGGRPGPPGAPGGPGSPPSWSGKGAAAGCLEDLLGKGAQTAEEREKAEEARHLEILLNNANKAEGPGSDALPSPQAPEPPKEDDPLAALFGKATVEEKEGKGPRLGPGRAASHE